MMNKRQQAILTRLRVVMRDHGYTVDHCINDQGQDYFRVINRGHFDKGHTERFGSMMSIVDRFMPIFDDPALGRVYAIAD